MRKLELDILGENYYLSKEVFKHDLSIAEVRLLVVLSSVKNITLSDLNHEQKMWISGSYREYSKLSGYEKHLIELNLIDKDGTGLELEKDFIIYRNTDILDNCKNIRQLFLSSLQLWYKGNDVIISEELFKTLFGSAINKNWKRTCEQLNIVCSWEKKNNNIYIKQDKTMSKVKEMFVETQEKEVKTEERVEEKREEINTEEERIELKNTFDESKLIAHMNSMYFSSDYIEPPSYTISEKEFEV